MVPHALRKILRVIRVEKFQLIRRSYLEEEPIGRIYHVRASWQRRAGIPGLGSWFTDRALAGGGPLIDLGVHVLDVALVLLGEPRVVSASAVSYDELGRAGRGGRARSGTGITGAFDVEDFASAMLRLDDGASIHLQASWASYSKVTENLEVELLGATGGARISIVDKAQSGTVSLYRDIAGAPVVLTPQIAPNERNHRPVARDFVAAVDAGQYGEHVASHALHRSRVLDAIYRSARENKEVAVA